ncbi:MAG: hypothetical protein ACLU4N_22010 [Butyricimonas faecihominis]
MLPYWGYTEVGIALNKKHLYNMPNASNWADMGGTSERFESCIGQFFGLYPTWWSPYGGAADDFCSDTYTGTDMSLHFEKWTYEPGAPSKNEYKNRHEIYFDSFNIMDQNTFCSTITYEQALRMRTVMENCPFRMMQEVILEGNVYPMGNFPSWVSLGNHRQVSSFVLFSKKGLSKSHFQTPSPIRGASPQVGKEGGGTK